jgi:hypothetical protein
MREAGNVYPTEISPEAWEVAMEIETSVAAFLKSMGLVRTTEHSAAIVVMARMVQMGINKAFDKAGVTQ